MLPAYADFAYCRASPTFQTAASRRAADARKLAAVSDTPFCQAERSAQDYVVGLAVTAGPETKGKPVPA
jgi:hypothetical protein